MGAGLLVMYNIIKESILITHGFCDEQYIIELRDYLVLKKTGASDVVLFLEYFNNDSLYEYIKVLKQVNVSPSSPRELIGMSDFITFGMSVKKFLKEATDKQKLLYYPILLWWHLTSIIPIRPIEFLRLRRNCIDQIDNQYWLKIHRSKNKGMLQTYLETGEFEREETLLINKRIYYIIKDYQDFTEQLVDSEFLMPSQAHIFRVGSEKRVVGWQIHRFKWVLNRFYDDIIIGKYKANEDINRLNPGDTRHYAFCNLLLQGFDSLTIARLGGHTTLGAQMWYHNHLDTFAESFTYSLTRMYKEQGGLYTELITRDNELIVRSRLHTPKFFRKMKYGYCTFEAIDSGCPIGECRCCQRFFLTPEEIKDPEVISWLKEYSTDLGKRIREQIAAIKVITEGINYDFEDLSWVYRDYESKTNSRSIWSDVYKKSLADYWLEEINEDEEIETIS